MDISDIIGFRHSRDVHRERACEIVGAFIASFLLAEIVDTCHKAVDGAFHELQRRYIRGVSWLRLGMECPPSDMMNIGHKVYFFTMSMYHFDAVVTDERAPLNLRQAAYNRLFAAREMALRTMITSVKHPELLVSNEIIQWHALTPQQFALWFIRLPLGCGALLRRNVLESQALSLDEYERVWSSSERCSEEGLSKRAIILRGIAEHYGFSSYDDFWTGIPERQVLRKPTTAILHLSREPSSAAATNPELGQYDHIQQMPSCVDAAAELVREAKHLRQLVRDGRFVEALQILDKLLPATDLPDDMRREMLALRSMTKKQIGDLKGAICDISTAIGLSRCENESETPASSAQLLLLRADLRHKIGDIRAARADCAMVADLSGAPVLARAQAVYMRGLLQNDSDAAQQDFRSVLEMPDATDLAGIKEKAREALAALI